VRNALAFNLAEAYIRQHRVNDDARALRTAKILLEDYIADHQRLYGNDADAVADREPAVLRLDDIDAMMRDSPPPATTPAVTPTATTAPQPSIVNQALLEREHEIKSVISADPVLDEGYRRARTMRITGWVLIGVGSAIAIVGPSIVGSQISAEDFDDPTRPPNPYGYGSFLAGVALVIPGAVLVPVGKRKAKEIEQQALLRLSDQRPRWSIAPLASREGGGASVFVRF